jgi:hypothetical protein
MGFLKSQRKIRRNDHTTDLYYIMVFLLDFCLINYKLITLLSYYTAWVDHRVRVRQKQLDRFNAEKYNAVKNRHYKNRIDIVLLQSIMCISENTDVRACDRAV